MSQQCKTGPDNQPSKSAMKVAQLQHTGPQLPRHPKPNQFSRQVEETRGLSKPDATQQQSNWSRPGQNPSWPRSNIFLQRMAGPSPRPKAHSYLAQPESQIDSYHSRPNRILLNSPEKYHPNLSFFNVNVELAQVAWDSAIQVGLKHCLAPRRRTTRNTSESQP